MTEEELMRRLRADAAQQLEIVERVTRLLPEDIRDQTLERRVILRKTIAEYDAALGGGLTGRPKDLGRAAGRDRADHGNGQDHFGVMGRGREVSCAYRAE